jgi:hypothetical protein
MRLVQLRFWEALDSAGEGLADSLDARLGRISVMLGVGARDFGLLRFPARMDDAPHAPS